MTTRRTFLFQVVPAAAAVTLLGSKAMAADKCSPDNKIAKALDYVTDTTKVDGKKYPKHAATQTCKNCLQYDSDGTCKMMKTCGVVEANGWCKSWVQNPKAK
ncbi:MAG: high-potential iron-sulfur protein [Neisseriaceae bacterium]|nr:high-potential iron-sulfur protein [Neisseriaceae bacterium]